ncbi:MULTISPECIES: hypothetical protein [unclassified Mesorhizobium]|uniref:hypothetical protein n=1 Tax=unclassified Mesorhizobium TaxID=325217 RepID=UPI003014D87A
MKAFKQTPYPDESEAPGAAPVCSNDKRANDSGYSSVPLYSDAFEAAGMVKCVFFYDAPMSGGAPMALEAGVGLAGTRLNTEFYFIPDDRGTLRLFWIITNGPAEIFNSLQQTMKKAYGEPRHRVEVWQSQGGNKLDNDIYTWSNSSSQIEFRHFGNRLTIFELQHTLTSLWDKLSKILDDLDTEAAKKL